MDPHVHAYRNEDVMAIYAFIPPGHRHARFVVETRDALILLQEATVAALVRAYAATAIHPSNRAVALRVQRLPPDQRKPGFAEHQALEAATGGEALDMAMEALSRYGLKYD